MAADPMDAQAQDEPLMPLDGRTLIAQGAEARVWECTFLGQPAVAKQRFRKKYRHPELDAKLTPARLKQEVRSMARARRLGVLTPALLHVEPDSSCIYMQRIVGRSLKQALHEGGLAGDELRRILAEVGRNVAALHDAGIVHGDLTTSNFMLDESSLGEASPPATDGREQQQQQQVGNGQQQQRQGCGGAPQPSSSSADAGGGPGATTPGRRLVVIDFGLSYNSTIPEDKAVDLYVLERAFLSTHASLEGLFDQVLTSYRRTSKQWSATLNRFADVRLRGRKRAMVG